MPTINYYWLQHPEVFQEEVTTGDIATIAIAAFITAALIIAIIFYLDRSLS